MNTAVAKANQGAVAPVERVEVNIQKMAEKFRPLLRDDEETARFCRVAINAVQQTPQMELVVQTREGCDSVYTACLQAASDRLPLDKKMAALVVYNEKFKDASGKEAWRKVAKYMPMYQGLVHLAYEGGVVKKISCQVVRALDEFAVQPSALGSPIHHKFPDDPFSRGELRGVYAVAQLHDGTWTDAEVMSVDDVEKIRKRSKSKDNGPWVTDFDEMARKTAIRRLSKYLPKTGAEHFHAAVERIDQLYDFDAPAIEGPPRKQMMASKLLAPATAKVEEAKAEVVEEAKQEPKKAAAKTEEKPVQKAATKKPVQEVDDDMAGFDERGGAVVDVDPEDWANGGSDV